MDVAVIPSEAHEGVGSSCKLKVVVPHTSGEWGHFCPLNCSCHVSLPPKDNILYKVVKTDDLKKKKLRGSPFNTTPPKKHLIILFHHLPFHR